MATLDVAHANCVSEIAKVDLKVRFPVVACTIALSLSLEPDCLPLPCCGVPGGALFVPVSLVLRPARPKTRLNYFVHELVMTVNDAIPKCQATKDFSIAARHREAGEILLGSQKYATIGLEKGQSPTDGARRVSGQRARRLARFLVLLAALRSVCSPAFSVASPIAIWNIARTASEASGSMPSSA